MSKIFIISIFICSSTFVLAQEQKNSDEADKIKHLIFNLKEENLLPDTLWLATSPYILNESEKTKICGSKYVSKTEQAVLSKELENQQGFRWDKVGLSRVFFISDDILKSKYVSASDSIKAIDKAPWEDYFRISKPLFTKNGRFAFVRITAYYQCESICGEGALWILENHRGKWILKERTDYWIQ